jgi:hypothetical protein
MLNVTRKAIKFYVFYWKKIDVKYEKGPNYCDVIFTHGFNGEFKSEYKIEKMFMELSERHNNFLTIDYGILILVNMKCLTFVGEYCGQLYQEKTPIL